MSGDPRVALDPSIEPAALLAGVLGSLGDAVFVVRPPDHRIVMTNEAAGALFLRDPADFLGRSTRMLHASDADHELFAERSEPALGEGRPYRGECDFRKSDGQIFQAEVTITAIDTDDSSKGVVSVLRDVSSLRTARATANTLLDELQKRVRELRCLHEVATILGDQEQPLEQALRRAVEQIPPAMMHRDAAAAAISYGDATVTTEGYADVGPRLEATFQMSSGPSGRLAVRYDPERVPAGIDAGATGDVAEAVGHADQVAGHSDQAVGHADEAAGHADEATGDHQAAGAEGPFQREEQALLESVASLLQSHFRTREHQARTEQERDRFMTLFRTGPMAMALSGAETSTFVT